MAGTVAAAAVAAAVAAAAAMEVRGMGTVGSSPNEEKHALTAGAAAVAKAVRAVDQSG